MAGVKPARSWQFDTALLRRIAPLPVTGAITREWAWGGSRGAGVKVAVVDSGIESTHPAIGSVEGAVALSYDDDSPNQVRVVEGPHEDLFGHGTACAGVI